MNPQIKYTDEEKLKAAYALNMCTVSVSQIVDYHDAYILEQEYDAILNNLNLKEMPKDEALLNILRELLDTITFFRIQDIKKEQIQKKYQQNIKNAIWSAIPNLSVVATGNPIALAFSLVTQIGSGYMNYRRTKANALQEKEDQEIELKIAAIEQFNGIKRELFTTAWRLADEYDFDDELRLTEKQIHQYNTILMDNNLYRRYARMETISERFKAYPPFWYMYGHTAACIAEEAKSRMNFEQDLEEKSKDQCIALDYVRRAKRHYEYYYSNFKHNLLREDQITAAFALEYVDLLWEEPNRDNNKIHELLKMAERMSPNAFDILQLCAVSYLKIGETADAQRLLNILVNEEYNTVSNARLLSKILSDRFILERDYQYAADYAVLCSQVNERYLFPMPKNFMLPDANLSHQLEETFMSEQKRFLRMELRHAINAFANQQAVKFNRVLPLPETAQEEALYESSFDEENKREKLAALALSRNDKTYCNMLRNCNFRAGYIRVLNETVAAMEELHCFKAIPVHDNLLYQIEKRIRESKNALCNIQKKMDQGSFNREDYRELSKYSYWFFTKDFLEYTKGILSDVINSIKNLTELESIHSDLTDFCENHKLPDPEEDILSLDRSRKENRTNMFFDNSLLGAEGNSVDYESLRSKMLAEIRNDISHMVKNSSAVKVHCLGEPGFSSYLSNNALRDKNNSLYYIQQRAFLILDDATQKNKDLILGVDGITLICKNNIQMTALYQDITYSSPDSSKDILTLRYQEEYINPDVDIKTLYSVCQQLAKMNERI